MEEKYTFEKLNLKVKCCQLETYKVLNKVTLYTIKVDGEAHSETDNFLLRFSQDPRFKKDLQVVISWLKRIGENGALDRYFRPERRGGAIPVTSSGLRLYCYRVSDRILILGNGGRKTSQKVQQSPDAFPHFDFINTFIKIFQKKLRNQDISYSGGEIWGDLTFEISEQPDLL